MMIQAEDMTGALGRAAQDLSNITTIADPVPNRVW